MLLEEEIIHKTGKKNISVKEMHVIEAVAKAEKKGSNTMKSVAEFLNLSPAALSISVNTLEKKGYIIRKGNEHDRRIVHVFLTEKGKKIDEIHEQFHFNMISKISDELNENEIKYLIASLKILKKYFYAEISSQKHKIENIEKDDCNEL